MMSDEVTMGLIPSSIRVPAGRQVEGINHFIYQVTGFSWSSIEHFYTQNLHKRRTELGT